MTHHLAPNSQPNYSVASIDYIKQHIQSNMICDLVEVEGDGHHFFATIVSQAFAPLKPLARHRLIYDLFGEDVGRAIHALSLKTYTPQEYAKQQK